MVARIVFGKTFRGILNYNENKVKAGKAECLDAVGFGCDVPDLNFKAKLFRFTDLMDRDKACHTNAMHISLNFDPSERPSDRTLKEIAIKYMEGIGFGNQPYLVYRHDDAGHSHIHIATTIVTEDGDRLPTHNIGKNESEAVRISIEKEFGLVVATEKKKNDAYVLNPIDLEKIRYGEVETKAAISNIVRSVSKYYNFASLSELNTVLRQFNVFADRGESGTRCFLRGGLMYQIIDENGKQLGNSIKASSIYEKPTLKNLEKYFPEKKEKRQRFKARLVRVVNEALENGVDKQGFLSMLSAEKVHAVFHENEKSQIYGVTFVDNKTHCVFKGSDLGDGYSAKSILDQLANGNLVDIAYNRQFVAGILSSTDFTGGIAKVMERWSRKGMLVIATKKGSTQTHYRLGSASTGMDSFVPADSKMSAYFRANGLTEATTVRIISGLKGLRFLAIRKAQPGHIPQEIILSEKMAAELSHIFAIAFHADYTGSYVPRELLDEAKKKKKKRHS
jgi:hypothetical protein